MTTLTTPPAPREIQALHRCRRDLAHSRSAKRHCRPAAHGSGHNSSITIVSGTDGQPSPLMSEVELSTPVVGSVRAPRTLCCDGDAGWSAHDIAPNPDWRIGERFHPA
jgi:hypothetical protein